MVKDKNGNYAVTQGVIKFDFGEKDRTEGPVVRRDDNRFSLTYKGNPLHFERAAKRAEAAAAASPAKGLWLVGAWAAKVKNEEGADEVFALILTADGKYTLAIGTSAETAKAVRGTFTFENGTLTLTADNGKKLAGRVSRLDADTFSIAVDGDAPLTFARVPTK